MRRHGAVAHSVMMLAAAGHSRLSASTAAPLKPLTRLFDRLFKRLRCEKHLKGLFREGDGRTHLAFLTILADKAGPDRHRAHES